ncbi:response regulator transcription factor [Niabella hirudinis]|uniref:response regulator transcription factor n=1 Tax=Niabella hirudinis TaxID=1285929 RepID=UPI003EB991D9
MDIRKQKEEPVLSCPAGNTSGVFDERIGDYTHSFKEAEMDTPGTSPRKITIAIADDCDVQHKLWGLLIHQNSSFELVCLAYNGQDLMHQIEAAALIPDICILDLEMPVMNGVCTAKHLSQRFPSIKLYGCTSCEDERMKKEMLRNSVITIFSKTENRNLLHTISQMQNPVVASSFSGKV